MHRYNVWVGDTRRGGFDAAAAALADAEWWTRVVPRVRVSISDADGEDVLIVRRAVKCAGEVGHVATRTRRGRR